MSGIGEYLKSKNPKVQIVAVEPASSPVLTKGEAGPHKIQMCIRDRQRIMLMN